MFSHSHGNLPELACGKRLVLLTQARGFFTLKIITICCKVLPHTQALLAVYLRVCIFRMIVTPKISGAIRDAQ